MAINERVTSVSIQPEVKLPKQRIISSVILGAEVVLPKQRVVSSSVLNVDVAIGNVIDVIDVGSSSVPDFKSNLNQSSYITGSWTPPTSGVIVLCVANTIADIGNIPTVTGNSLTWVRASTFATDPLVSHRLTWFVASTTGATVGVTTIDFGGQIQSTCDASFTQLLGVEMSGGVINSVIQTPTASGTGQGGTVLFQPLSHGLNKKLVAFFHQANESTTKGISWKRLDAFNDTGRSFEVQSADQFSDQAVSTWTTSSVWIASGIEIGATAIYGNVNKTLDSLSISSDGLVIVSLNRNGELFQTLENVSLSSNGSVGVVGNLDVTLEQLHASSAGEIDVLGESTISLENILPSISGQVLVRGESASYLNDAFLVSMGNIFVNGNVSVILEDVSLLAQASTITSLDLNITLNDVSTNITGVVSIDGELNKTLDNLYIESSASVLVRGLVSTQLENVQNISSGLVLVDASLNKTLDGVFLSSGGTALISGSVSVTLENVSIDYNLRFGGLNVTLGNIIGTITGSTTYRSNHFIFEYLNGKGLFALSFDYRYYYFYDGVLLRNQIDLMPYWYLILTGDLWGGSDGMVYPNPMVLPYWYLCKTIDLSSEPIPVASTNPATPSWNILSTVDMSV